MDASVDTAEIPAAERNSVTSLPENRPTVSLASRLARSWTWLKWPVALGILAWLYFQNQKALADIAAAPKNWSFAFLAFGLIGGAALVTFGRWYLLVRAQEFPFRFATAVQYGFVGMMMNYVAPGSVGGDLFKAVLLARDHSSRRTIAVATVVLDRILGMLALFMIGALATLLPHDFPDSPEVQANTAFLWIGTLGGLTGLGVMLLPAMTNWKWVQRLEHLPLVGRPVGELIHGVKVYQSKPLALFAALGLSLIGHAGLISGFYCCARWVDLPWIPNLAEHFYFMPNAELFGVVSMTPAGMGALEWAIKKAYVLMNSGAVTEADAGAAGFTAAIAFRVISIALAAIGGAYFFTSRREISAAIEEASHTPAQEEPA